MVLTGDIHTSWTNDIPGANYDAGSGSGSAGVEFVTPSITTLNSPLPVAQNIIRLMNPHMKYVQLSEHGYINLTVNRDSVQADWIYMGIDDSIFTETRSASHYARNGENHLRAANQPVFPRPGIGERPRLLPNQGIEAILWPELHQETHIEESQWDTICLFPSHVRACPELSINVVGNPDFGILWRDGDYCFRYRSQINFCGSDSALVEVCQLSNPVSCDTVHLIYQISNNIITEQINFVLEPDSTVDFCVSVDDLFDNNRPGNHLHNGPGTTIVSQDSCFTYTAPSFFCGTDTIYYISCDAAPINKCDTVLIIIQVLPDFDTQSRRYSTPNDSTLEICVTFDDLFGEMSQATALFYNGPATFIYYDDSCLLYVPLSGFVGTDSVFFVACDAVDETKCDAVVLEIDVYDRIIDTVGTSVGENSQFAVFSLFPNPAKDRLMVQFYTKKQILLDFKE